MLLSLDLEKTHGNDAREWSRSRIERIKSSGKFVSRSIKSEDGMNFLDNLIFRTRIVAMSPRHKPGVQESTPQNHHGLAGRLFELHLNAGELLVYDLHHPFNLLRRDWPCAALFPQQIHHVRSELVTCLKQTKTGGVRHALAKPNCLSYWMN